MTIMGVAMPIGRAVVISFVIGVAKINDVVVVMITCIIVGRMRLTEVGMTVGIMRLTEVGMRAVMIRG